MATKKGIFLTIGILTAITTSSFLIWMIPQNNQNIFVVSDFETYLNNVKEIHDILLVEIEEDFQKMLNEEISPDDYIKIAEITSSQINSEIIQIVGSDPPEEWFDSYFNYIEALKKSNSYIRETIVVANIMKNDGEEEKIKELLATINDIRRDSKSFSLASDEARP